MEGWRDEKGEGGKQGLVVEKKKTSLESNT